MTETVGHALHQRDAAFDRVVGGKRQTRSQHVGRVVAAVDAQQRDEAARQEGSADQEHARQGQLAGHDQRPRARSTGAHPSADRRAAVFGQRLDQIDAPCVPGRQQSARDARRSRRADGEQEHAPIDLDVGDPWKIGGQHRRQRRVQCDRKHDACEAAARAGHDALDDELARQPRRTGADGRADCHLAPARTRVKAVRSDPQPAAESNSVPVRAPSPQGRPSWYSHESETNPARSRGRSASE